jgi:hypothetical protein
MAVSPTSLSFCPLLSLFLPRLPPTDALFALCVNLSGVLCLFLVFFSVFPFPLLLRQVRSFFWNRFFLLQSADLAIKTNQQAADFKLVHPCSRTTAKEASGTRSAVPVERAARGRAANDPTGRKPSSFFDYAANGVEQRPFGFHFCNQSGYGVKNKSVNCV